MIGTTGLVAAPLVARPVGLELMLVMMMMLAFCRAQEGRFG